MKIVADENIPYLDQFFGSFGEIIKLPGRGIDAAAVQHADVLLVRSITQVDESLLKNSTVDFVGSATIGTDHIDIEYLNSKGVRFSNAPGCNADSVVQYVLAAMLHLSQFYGFDIGSKSVGIIGYGNIGSRLQRSLIALGIKTKVYDPFMPSGTTESLVCFDEVIQTDLVTLHVPFSTTGEHPTHHMINEQVLANMSPNTVLINSSRGAVIDNTALLKSLMQNPRPVILDVWENEPNIEWRLLEHLILATPHIAGYSAEGKARGTEMLYQALVKRLGQDAEITLDQIMPVAPISQVIFSEEALSRELRNPIGILSQLISCCYNIEADDKRLRLAQQTDSDKRVKSDNQPDRDQQFDLLRKNYGGRREFCSLELQLDEQAPSDSSQLIKTLETLGFKMKPQKNSRADA